MLHMHMKADATLERTLTKNTDRPENETRTILIPGAV